MYPFKKIDKFLLLLKKKKTPSRKREIKEY